MNGVRRYRNGQSSLAGFGVGGSTTGRALIPSPGGAAPARAATAGPSARMAISALKIRAIGGVPNESVSIPPIFVTSHGSR